MGCRRWVGDSFGFNNMGIFTFALIFLTPLSFRCFMSFVLREFSILVSPLLLLYGLRAYLLSAYFGGIGRLLPDMFTPIVCSLLFSIYFSCRYFWNFISAASLSEIICALSVSSLWLSAVRYCIFCLICSISLEFPELLSKFLRELFS